MAINYNDEKIGKFYQAILHYGEEQRKKIEEEVAAFKQKELDEAEIGVLTEAYHLIQKEMAQMRSGIARELAQREMDGRRALLEQRRKIMEQVFSRAAEELSRLHAKAGVCSPAANLCAQSLLCVPKGRDRHPSAEGRHPLSAADCRSLWAALPL